ncbi:hypothetical protein Trebr_0316 [Treponema brennaborense DSM 12168]|uniref:DUF2281 domain-containing protein n=1 Tax=Treponema brennaborense (strain DSM 12168 / CIP 105900 / DD5/3) TaxID=906968 RepID=F4LMX7_TREBD|nr:hypothetical protein Trebr_0316 [Treponema brennaborense DSM 12168]
MPYELVAEKLKTLKETDLQEVSEFIDFIQFRTGNNTNTSNNTRRRNRETVLKELSGIIPPSVTDSEVKDLRTRK